MAEKKLEKVQLQLFQAQIIRSKFLGSHHFFCELFSSDVFRNFLMCDMTVLKVSKVFSGSRVLKSRWKRHVADSTYAHILTCMLNGYFIE